MSQVTEKITSAKASKYSPSVIDGIYLLILLSMGPMLWLQCNSLWNRPHLQFFPMAWLAFGYFLYDRSPGIATTANGWRQFFAVGILGGSLGAAGFAVLISSPWLSYVAAIGVVTSWSLLRVGGLHWFTLLGLTSLLWITVALPAGYDEKMIRSLQAISSSAASNFLDAMWITHLREGNILQLTGKRLFVDEACSGVDSLYALMAISLTIVLWFRQPLIVAICALSMVPVWAGCSNLIRLVAIVLAFEWFGIDLSSGMPHTVLGLATFVIAFMCDFAFICFLGAFFEKPVMLTKEERAERPWLHTVPPRPIKTERTSSAASTVSVFAWAVPALLAVCFSGIGAYSMRVFGRGTVFKFPEFTEPSLASLKENLHLPNQMGNWTLGNSEIIQRERNSVMGQFSHVWIYGTQSGTGMLSVDFAFRGFHLLDVCYEGAGWVANNPRQIKELEVASSAFGNKGAVQVHTLDFKKDTGEFIYVVFTQFQLDGTPVHSSTNIRGMERIENTILSPVTYQVQSIFMSSQPSTAEEQEQTFQNLVHSVDVIRPAFIGMEAKEEK